MIDSHKRAKLKMRPSPSSSWKWLAVVRHAINNRLKGREGMFGLNVTMSADRQLQVPQHQGSRESAGTWAGQSLVDGKHSRSHADIYWTRAAIPSLLLPTSTSPINLIFGLSSNFPLLSLSVPPSRSSGDKWGIGSSDPRRGSQWAITSPRRVVGAPIARLRLLPSGLPHQPRVAPRLPLQRVLQETTVRFFNRFIRFSRSHQEICQYEYPHHGHPPNINHHIMIPGLLTSPIAMVSADRQQVIETNRSLRNIKNVRPPLPLPCPSPYRH